MHIAVSFCKQVESKQDRKNICTTGARMIEFSHIFMVAIVIFFAFLVRLIALSQDIDTMLETRGYENIGLYAHNTEGGWGGSKVRLSSYDLDPSFPDREIYMLACKFDRILKRFFRFVGAVAFTAVVAAIIYNISRYGINP